MPAAVRTSRAIISIVTAPPSAPVAITSHVAALHAVAVAVGTEGWRLSPCRAREQGPSGSNDQRSFHKGRSLSLGAASGRRSIMVDPSQSDIPQIDAQL